MALISTHVLDVVSLKALDTARTFVCLQQQTDHSLLPRSVSVNGPSSGRETSLMEAFISASAT